MIERRETGRLPAWTDDVLTPEQRRVLRRRFGLLDDEADADGDGCFRGDDPDGGEGGGTPAPATPPAPPRPRRRRDG